MITETDKNKKNDQNAFSLTRGFTLIETFVAVTILMIAVLGPMSILSKSLYNSNYLKNEMIATFLAQEGVEIMIDRRNQVGAATPENLASFLDKASSVSDNICLKSDPANPSYGYYADSSPCPAGEKTPFFRTVSVVEEASATPPGPTDQYLVTSTVKVAGRNTPIIARTRIFSW